MLMIAFITDMIAFAVANGLNVYYWKEVVGNSSYTSLVTFGGLVAGLPFVLMIPQLCKKFGKGAVLSGGSILTAIVYLIIFFSPTDNAGILAILFIIAAGTAIIPSTVGWAMLPDIVEYGEWKHGIRGEGILTSGLTFTNKLGMALGGMLTGFALTVIGYDASLALQTTETIRGIIFCRAILPVIGYACSVLAMFFYDLDNKKNAQIMDELMAQKTSINAQ